MEAAVHIRGAVKQYNRKIKVLQGLDMTVTKGTIYALLGASGCGKTTLLNCIVGRRKLDAGEISVLGGKPGSRGSGVPGPRIGYMPQEIGLLGEFSVKGAIFYFGWLFGMNNKQLEERYEFLSLLLNLPPDGRYIKNLSGGQQRRVSFAAALVHGAELLILDEPTVGLDPELRHTIWEHLTSLTLDHKVTVIITTHYIEEARQAHMIGLMRQGRLLAESSPQSLLDFYKCSSLEEVFLKLSIRQSRQQGEAVGAEPEELPSPLQDIELDRIQVEPAAMKKERLIQPPQLNRMKALLVKNFIGVLRSPGEIIFVLVIPFLQIALFFLAIGGHPQGLRLAVVNHELGNYSDCAQFLKYEDSGVVLYDEEECHLAGMSCKFLARINDSIAVKDYYEDEEEALAAVRRGEAVGALLFTANFSDSLAERGRLGRDTPSPSVDSSEVHVHMDMSDEQIGIVMQALFYEEFRVMGEEIADSCNRSARAVRIPMQFKDPVYGTKYPKYVDYVAPRYIISVVYFLSTTLTTTVLITDRTDGIWDRNYVAGVTVIEAVLAHVLCQSSCVLIYSAEVIFLSLVVFGMRCQGSIITVILIICIQGISGMTYGLVISVLCSSYFMAVFIAVGSLVPFICLSGVVWPVEGMHYLLKPISLMMPCTLANHSLSHVLEKGWNLLQPQVYTGFLVSFVWIGGQLLLCLLVLRFKQ
ncbi:ABC transporter G family member 23 [Anabrus simplex]|uniref:ABC transporter G family member 23 n=1 Tax=Anabrus simplex TaxID=316456 RepID=UPI0035A37A34